MPSPLVMFESTMQARHDLLVARLVLWFKIPPADHEIENNCQAWREYALSCLTYTTRVAYLMPYQA